MNIKALLLSINYNAIEAAVKWNFLDKYFAWLPRSKLKNTNFSIIGNNCFTGGIYHKFGLPYTSPTIWTYIFPDDYLRFLKNFDWYLKQPLNFLPSSQHAMSRRFTEITHRKYPIGLLGDDVEIHFMHYKTKKEVLEKWNKRVKRINFSNLFVVFSDGEEFRQEHYYQFERLPYKHKIFLSSKQAEASKITVFVRECAESPHVYDVTKNRKYEKYWDVIKWLNCQEDFLKK
jgi:uncharacterized protein (DUF1919 family)